MTSIKEVFENKLKIDSKTRSVDSLFNNVDNRKNTDYKPPYQRNYVWDDEKATYFIESILLGTEIPPLIYFRNISKVEVIDGRQRYQTLLRFIENGFKLKRSGLKKLSTKEFIGKNFDSLNEKYRELIWETKLRIIEFSFNTKDGITDIIEEKVKREIFKRYNSGITPLKTNEIDKAEYLYDDVNQYFKNEVISEKRILELLKLLFHFEKFNEEVLLKKIRELLVIENIPIKYFSIKKSNIINQFYDFLYSNMENNDLSQIHTVFISKINLLDRIYLKIHKKDHYNRLVSECLFWALSIFYKEKGNLNISNSDIARIAAYVDENFDSYIMDRSSFAIHIKNRYENISKIFKDLYEINFDIYLKDSISFNDQISTINKKLDNTEVIGFDDLRIHKPEPSSFSIDDVVRSMKRLKFSIRPQYQRSEIIDKKKASSIIESILLGIKIPPIFVYKNEVGVSEVIDGQQRLLSVLGFIGEDFINTDDEYESSKKESYSLNLKNSILSDLSTKKFKDLSTEDQLKIKNYDFWVVEIDSKYNKKFDPVDLFIRLNYKPYPIKIDSFEMWNSYISRPLINTIKDVFDNNKEWFYFRKSTTRMENENILTALIYLHYQFLISQNASKSYEALDYYKIGDKINFRLKSKPDLTRTLENESQKLAYISNLFEADFITKLKILIIEIPQKNLALSLDYLLCVDNGRRTQQSLYALWYFINEISVTEIRANRIQIIEDIRALFTKMNKVVKIVEFKDLVKSFKKKHNLARASICIHSIKLENILIITRGLNRENLTLPINKEIGNEFASGFTSFSDIVKLQKNKILIDEDFKISDKQPYCGYKIAINEVNNLDHFDVYLNRKNYFFDDKNFILEIKREGFAYEYLYLFLSSKKIFDILSTSKKLSKSNLGNLEIPVLDEKQQNVFKKLYNVIFKSSNQDEKSYYINIVDKFFEFLANSSSFKVQEINFIELLDYLSVQFDSNSTSQEIYKILSSSESLVSLFILRMNYFTDNEKNN